MPTLSLPTHQFKTSYLSAVAEHHAEHAQHYANLDIRWLDELFEEYLEQLADEAKGKNLPEGYLPHTEFWLVEGREYLGRLDIRHLLNDQLKKTGGHIGYDIRPTQRRKGYGKLILQLGLQKAKEMGLEHILVTCDVDNIGSNKIIQANGGVLEDIHPQGPDLPDKCRYWIRVQ